MQSNILQHSLGTLSSEALLCLSDTHCGSDYGLMPPAGSFTLVDGSKNSQNPLQAALWNAFVEHSGEALRKIGPNPFSLVINGDAIEGIHHKNDEALAKVDDHKRCAAYCLGTLSKKALASGGRVFVIVGTECHTRRDEHGLGRELGATSPKNRPDLHAFDSVDFDWNGLIVNATHHMPTTSRAYLEAGALSIILGNNTLNRVRENKPLAHILLRAHRHVAGIYSNGRQMICVNGSYQVKTRHGIKVVPDSGTWPSQTLLLPIERGKLPYAELIGSPIEQTQVA